jgi:hypothetical protein
MSKTISLLFIMCVVCLYTTAFAGCYATEETIMYFDPARFGKVARICVTNRNQCIQMMKMDVITGDATIIPKGTRFDDLAVLPDNKYGCVVRMKNIFLIGLTEATRCD